MGVSGESEQIINCSSLRIYGPQLYIFKKQGENDVDAELNLLILDN
jgi:hypothetical protein